MLVLVGTAKAVDRAPVLREVRLFREMGKRVLPIDVDGALTALPQEHPLRGLLSDTVLRVEEPDAKAPSASTVERVVAARTGEFVAARRLRVMRQAACGFAALAICAAVFGVISFWQRNLAVAAEREATRRAATLDWRLAEQARLDTGTETPNPVLAARYLIHAALLSESAGDDRKSSDAVLAAINETRQLVWTGNHGAPIEEAVAAPNGDRLLTYSLNGRLQEWSVRDGALLNELDLSGTLSAAGYSPDGGTLFAVYSDKPLPASGIPSASADRLGLWDATSWKIKKATIKVQVEPVTSPFVFDPTGRRLLVDTPDAYNLVTIATGAPGRSIAKLPDALAPWPRFSRDGEVLLWTEGGVLRTFRLDERKDRPPIAPWTGVKEFATGRRYVTLFQSDGVRRLPIVAGERETFFAQSCDGVLLSSDQRYCLAWDVAGNARLWNLETSEPGPLFSLISSNGLGHLPAPVARLAVSPRYWSIVENGNDVTVLDRSNLRVWQRSSEQLTVIDVERGLAMAYSSPSSVDVTTLGPDSFTTRINYAQTSPAFRL